MPHFRVGSLVNVGAWDEWNVTEDADLGIRLARFGYRVETFDSDTWEEAPHELGNWCRRRVRWQKGWMRPVNDYLCSRNIKRLVHLQLAELARVATPSQQTGETGRELRTRKIFRSDHAGLFSKKTVVA